MVSLPKDWISSTDPDEQNQCLSKVENLPLDGLCPPVRIVFTYTDGRWFVHSCEQQLMPSNCAPLETIPCSLTPSDLTPSDLPTIVEVLDSCVTCPRNHDTHYCELAQSQNGVFKDSTSTIVKAKLHTSPFLLTDASCCHSTIRTVNCDILVKRETAVCSHCKAYRPVLQSLHRKWENKAGSSTDTSIKTNWRYLSTPEKKRRYQGQVTEVVTCNMLCT